MIDLWYLERWKQEKHCDWAFSYSPILDSAFKLKKVKPLYRPKWPMGPVLNSSFLCMKWLKRSIATPPGWDANPSQGYPQHIYWYSFVHLGEEKPCESIESCLRTQHNNPRAWTQTTWSGGECTNHEATPPPQFIQTFNITQYIQIRWN